MKKIVAILLCLFFSACMVENLPVQLPVSIEQIAEGQSVLIRINEGIVTVRGSEEGQVRVDGQTLSLDRTEYNVKTTNDQIQIIVEYAGRRSSNPSIRLDVEVPNDTTLIVETDSAAVIVRQFAGVLVAASVSGDVLVEDVQGDITLRSNRGNLTVQNSAGRVSMVGNYGLLSLENVGGNVGVSTIMGIVEFNGLIQADDGLRLETDHGPVSVKLNRSSALTLQVRSTSGDVACMLPGMSSTARTCDGTFGTGSGSLFVRTVSGAVTVQLLP